MLGISQGGGGRRNETLTKDTKTTFSLNWGFCENGTSCSMFTLMGPPVTKKQACSGAEEPDEVGTILYMWPRAFVIHVA